MHNYHSAGEGLFWATLYV